MIADHTETVELVAQYTFTISATPADATVIINDVEQTSLTANVNTAITWSVAKEGYTTQTGTHTLIANYTETVVLVEASLAEYLLSPSGATKVSSTTPAAEHNIMQYRTVSPAHTTNDKITNEVGTYFCGNFGGRLNSSLDHVVAVECFDLTTKTGLIKVCEGDSGIEAGWSTSIDVTVDGNDMYYKEILTGVDFSDREPVVYILNLETGVERTVVTDYTGIDYGYPSSLDDDISLYGGYDGYIEAYSEAGQEQFKASVNTNLTFVENTNPLSNE